MDFKDEYNKVYLMQSLNTKDNKVIDPIIKSIKEIEKLIDGCQKLLLKEDDIKKFEHIRRKIDQLEIKRFLLANPVRKDEPIDVVYTTTLKV